MLGGARAARSKKAFSTAHTTHRSKRVGAFNGSEKETMGKGKEKGFKEILAHPLPEPDVMEKLPTRWVQVHFRLMGFSALDDVCRLPPTANLHMVESKIIAHHGGSIEKLLMWKDEINPSNVLRDFTQRLSDIWRLDNESVTDRVKQYGMGHASMPQRKGEPEDHKVVIYYDYRAHDSDCPLLLCSPRYPQKEKKEEEAKDKKK